MTQTLHLLIVDGRQRAALVGGVAAKWLLPILTCAERKRTEAVALRWVHEHGFDADVVGRWLGRLGSDGVDWLLVIAVARPRTVREARLEWTPLERLSPASALIEFQGWAVGNALDPDASLTRPGPFGRFAWPEDVTPWIGAAAGSGPSSTIPYRVTPHEVVLGAETARGRVYFKGLTGQRVVEVRVTQRLASLMPASFAQTLAFEARPDGSVWWLGAHCPGTAGIGATLVAGALARLQQRVLESQPTLDAIPPVDLSAAARWALALVDDEAFGASMDRAIERVTTSGVADSWIPMDLDPSNALVDGSDVRFIDLDDSFLGPAPLAIAVYASRCRDRSLCHIYEQCWSFRLGSIDWPSFEIVAALFETWLGWQRLQRKFECGELCGALDFATRRIRERLLRAVRGAATAAHAAYGR